MPRTLTLSPGLEATLARQDGVVTLAQLEAGGFPPAAALRRAREGRWSKPLPGIVLASAAPPSRRQRLIAAALWAGPGSAIDGPCACAWYGVRPDGMDETRVHVVVPWQSGARSLGFVVVRRALAEVTVGGQGSVPYVDPATALIVAARNTRSPRDSVAVLSRGLQQGITDEKELRRAREAIGDKYCRPVDHALVAVGAGVRSPAEDDSRKLILTSRVLPPPRWNQWLDLGDGGYPVCVDALWEDAGMIHEINGRRYHAWDTSFENMHARQERVSAAGIVVVPSTPTRLRTAGPAVLDNLERTYLWCRGRGLPPGVRLIDPPDFHPSRI